MKKLPNPIKEQLQHLSAIKPCQNWKIQTQQNLINELKIEENTGRTQHLIVRQVISSFFHDLLSKFSWRPIGLFVLMLGVIVGPGFATVSAAQASLPGDKLYPIKRSIEKVQITLTISELKKAEKELDFVGNRLNELHRITQEQSPSPERQEKITLALQELEKDTTNVKTRLEQAKNANGVENEDVVQMAKTIDEKSLDYNDTLKAAVSSLEGNISDGTEKNLKQALSTVQDVAINALDIIVKNSKEEDGTSTDEEIEDLNTRVNNQLDTTKELIVSLQNRLLQIQKAEVVVNENEDEDDLLVEDKIEETSTEEVETNVKDEDVDTQETDQRDTSVVTESITEEKDTEPADDKNNEESVQEESGSAQDVVTFDATELLNVIETKIFVDMKYAQELVELEDFTEALNVLTAIKVKVTDLSKQIREQEDQLNVELESKQIIELKNDIEKEIDTVQDEIEESSSDKETLENPTESNE